MPRKPPAKTPEQQSDAALARFDPDLAASVLAAAVITGDARAADQFDIHIKTVRAWRARMATDAELEQKFYERARFAREHWADSLIPGIQAHIAAGMDLVQRGIRDPLTFAESNNALRVLLDSQFSLEILYARIRQYDSGGAPPGEHGIPGADVIDSGR